MSTLGARSVSLHHDGVCTKHLFGHLRTMMTRANSLRSREAGSPINVSVIQGPTPTQASPHTPRLRLPRQATTAEFRVVDLIAQHDPEPNPQLPRRRDVGLRESLLRHLSSIEALQVRIPSDGMGCRLTPEEPQERIALFGERAQSLPLAARVLARDTADAAGQRFPVEKSCGIAHEDFRRQCRDGPDARMGHEHRGSRPFLGDLLDPLAETIDVRIQMLIQRLELTATMRGMRRQRQ